MERISLHGGGVVQDGVGSFARDFERRMKVGFGSGVSLCGSSVKGTWNGLLYKGP